MKSTLLVEIENDVREFARLRAKLYAAKNKLFEHGDIVMLDSGEYVFVWKIHEMWSDDPDDILVYRDHHQPGQLPQSVGMAKILRIGIPRDDPNIPQWMKEKTRKTALNTRIRIDNCAAWGIVTSEEQP